MRWKLAFSYALVTVATLLAIECIVAAIVVGGGIGWLVDRVSGTSPFGFIAFFLLGFVAGIINVMRAAGLSAGTPPSGDEGT